MDTAPHNLSTLFDQLGMPSDANAIESFITEHKPLPEDIQLSEASFWNESQAEFIRSSWNDDADWAITIDELNVRLREHH